MHHYLLQIKVSGTSFSAQSLVSNRHYLDLHGNSPCRHQYSGAISVMRERKRKMEKLLFNHGTNNALRIQLQCFLLSTEATSVFMTQFRFLAPNEHHDDDAFVSLNGAWNGPTWILCIGCYVIMRFSRNWVIGDVNVSYSCDCMVNHFVARQAKKNKNQNPM